MRKLIVIAALCVPIISNALSDQVMRIFSKDRRLIAAPPRTLLADRRPSGAKQKKYKDLEVSTKPEDESDVEKIEEQPVSEPYSKKAHRKKKVESEDQAERTQNEGNEEKASTGGRHHQRTFGVGLVGGGAYGVFGGEVDFRIADQWSGGFGVGTGMSYSTWGIQSRYFFSEGAFSPFTQMGYASWYLERISHTGEKVKPEYLANRFFGDKNGKLTEDSRLHLIYGGIGVLYQAASGVAASLQLQYFIHLQGFEGGLYGAFGMYYYF